MKDPVNTRPVGLFDDGLITGPMATAALTAPPASVQMIVFDCGKYCTAEHPVALVLAVLEILLSRVM